MNLSGNTILITGGGTGIGLALADAFLAAGNTVIICGRRLAKLEAAQATRPGLHIRACDVSQAAEREALYAWVSAEFPALNLLINNAGVQRRLTLTEGAAPYPTAVQEVETNLLGPIHLAMLFYPLLARQAAALLINVTSGLAYTPWAGVPVYGATKAGLHSFTVALRHQLKGTSVRVMELIPPIVNTDLQGEGYIDPRGIETDELVAAALDAIQHDEPERAIGLAAMLREKREALFSLINPENPE